MSLRNPFRGNDITENSEQSIEDKKLEKNNEKEMPDYKDGAEKQKLDPSKSNRDIGKAPDKAAINDSNNTKKLENHGEELKSPKQAFHDRIKVDNGDNRIENAAKEKLNQPERKNLSDSGNDTKGNQGRNLENEHER